MPIKAGTNVYPHVHWTGSGTGNGGDVGFEFSYTPAVGYGVEAFPTTVQFTIEDTPSATADTHEITEVLIGDSFNTNLEVDSIVLCRIKRVAPAGTDYNGDVFIHQLDFHVEVDGRKTNERNAPHTKYGS
jgi:hypothetical protein